MRLPSSRTAPPSRRSLHGAVAVRRFVIGMTVTGEERKRIKAAAEAEDLTISAWLRRLVLGGLKKG